MKIGSLFSGLGGFELGLEWAGVGHTVWQCEINPFGRRILRRHWPDAQMFEDITTLGREVEVPPVDVICGGFPCQDISVAGRQAGLEGTRSGLFYEMVRIIRSVRPIYIVLENVSNIIAQRDTLNAVLSELHQSGYDGEWSIVSAADVGAPHLRRRWFFIGWRRELANADGISGQWRGQRHQELHSHRRSTTNPPRPEAWPPKPGEMQLWQALPVDNQPAICRGFNGVSTWLGNINRIETLKALGNAIVPQCAELVGRRLLEIQRETQ